MVTKTTESLLLGILSFLGGSSFGMSSLGVALIFEIGYFMLGSMAIFTSETLTQANVYLTVAFLPMAFIEAVYLRKHWNILFVVCFGIPTALFTILGIIILNHNDNIWLARALGIFLLISFAILCVIEYRKYRQFRELQEFNPLNLQSHDEHQNDSVLNLVDNTSSNSPRSHDKIRNSHFEHEKSMDEEGVEWNVDSIKRALVLIVLGICSGLLRGLWGVAGVPIMFFALLTNINKDEFRASTAFAMILSEGVSVVQLLIIEDNLEIQQSLQYIAILIGGFIGLLVGNKLSPYLNQQSFHVLIIYLIFCGAIILTTRGFINDMTDLIVSVCLSVIGIILTCYWLYYSCKQRRILQKVQDGLELDELPQQSL